MKRSLRTRLSIILAMVMLLGYAITAFGGSGTTGITSEKGVEPVVYKDNRPPEHKSPFVKLDTGKMGTYQLLKNDEIQVEIYKTNEGNYQGVTAVHWESTIAISYVWVKGGNCGSLYVYGSDVKEDSGLYAPINPETSKPYGVSHVTFYYDDESPGEPPECGSVTVTKVDDSNNHTLTGWEFILYKETSSDVYVQADEPKTTDENGQASWDSLEPGNYKVVETKQSGWKIVSPQNGESEFALEESHHKIIEFRNKQESEQTLGSISGMKFHDKNYNGQRDDGEEGLEGWTIGIYNNLECTEAAIDSQTTDRDGKFSFENLPLGTYYLKEIMSESQAEEYRQTAPVEEIVQVVLTEGSQTHTDVEFGNIELDAPDEPPEFGSITVTKVDHSNSLPLAEWQFTLYKETSPGVYAQADEPKTTDENGQASWDSLEPGTYKVIETEQSGWEPVDPESGGFEFELAAGTQETVEFRNKQEPEQILGSISGMKFHDKNANGKRDPGEKGLNGWTIELYTDANAQVSIALAASDIELVARVETSDGGEFHFNDLPLGRYYLKEAMTSKQSQEYEQTVPKSNWFTIELTEATKDVEDVLFGNKQKRTPPVEDPEEPEEPKEPEKPEEPEEPPVDEPPTEEPPVEEPPVEETPVDEPDTEIIEDPEIPLAELPTTGGIPPMVNYGIGMLLTVTGVAIKRRRKP